MSNTNGSANEAESARVSVIGGGAWGLALATAASLAGSDVLLYARRDGLVLPPRVKQTRDLAEAASHASLIVLALPSESVRGVASALGDHVDGRHAIVHGVRGLVSVAYESGSEPSLQTISSVVRDETPVRRLGALGGPVLTSELAKGMPSVIVVASRYPDVIASVRRAFGAPSLRVYPTDDLVGLEWASALTGILAVAVGFARGRGMGAGIVAAFVSRGVHEAARVAVAAGADERTFLGLGGFGDLLAAIADESRPEVRFGDAIAKGASLEDAAAMIGQRIEAIELAPKIADFGASRRVHSPILHAIAHWLRTRASAEELVQLLMLGPIAHGA